MLKAQYALICEWVRTGSGGTVDFLGVLDRIYAAGVPAQHGRVVFCVLLVGEGEDDLGKKPFVQRLVAPSGKLLVENRGTFDLKPAAGTWLAGSRLDFQFEGLVLPESGRYWFRLEVDGREIAAHPLTVVKGATPSR